MKLALIVPGGVDRSGEFRVIPALLALIARLVRTHEVHVFALQQEKNPDRWELLGAQVHNIGVGCQRWRTIVAIFKEHRRTRFDCIHAIFSGSCGLVAVAAATLLHVASIVHIGGGELVALPDIDYGGYRKWKSRFRERLVLRSAGAVTAASTPIIDILRTLDIRAHRVPLGVDLQAWPPAPPRRRSRKSAKLIHVANLNRVKDQPSLLRALAELVETGVEFEIDFVGFDSLHGEIERLAAALGLEERVRFLGFKTQSELRPLVQSADLLVMTSRHETGPVALLEAAIAGVPAVGTAVGHFVEWAPLAALAVPVNDWKALAEAIRMLLADEELRLQIACAAQQRALRENADFTADLFESLYAQLKAQTTE